MREHVILIAFGVEGESEEEAQEHLMGHLIPLLSTRNPNSRIEEWWIAEDNRTDRSDLESAVFVPQGISQREARQYLEVIAGVDR